MEPILDCRWARKVMDMEDDEHQNISNASEDAKPDENIENRPYQGEMVDRALRENIICAIGTGLGKNEVAISVLKSLIHEIEPSWNEGGKRTIVVVSSVLLIEEQVNFIRKWISFPVKGYHGSDAESANSTCSKETWNKELNENCVLVILPEILKNLIQNDLIAVSRINLLILDECHHAVKDESYREMIDCIHQRPQSEWPRILGLTDFLINFKLKNGSEEMETFIRSLENCLGAKVCTPLDQSLKHSETTPTVVLETFEVFPPDDGEKEAIEGLEETLLWMNSAKNYIFQLEKTANFNNKNLSFFSVVDDRFRLTIAKSLTVVNSALKNLKENSRTLGPWCAYQTAGMVKKDLDLMLKNDCFHKEMTNPILGAISQIHIFGTLLELHYKVHKIIAGDIDGVLKASSPKLRKLLNVLRNNRPVNADPNDSLAGLCCIVFVASRFHAWALHKFFEFLTTKINGDFSFIKSGFLTGQQQPSGLLKSEDFIPQQIELATFEKFRRGDINVLVTADLMEEGLDLPDCNLIIRFDESLEYCSYLQSKGRARTTNSKLVILSSSQKLPELRKSLEAFDVMDDVIRKTCDVNRISSVVDPKQKFGDALPDSFTPSGSHVTVTLNSAHSFLQRYCKTLLGDRNGSSVCQGQFLDTAPDVFVYRIYMPLSSAIKRPVTGAPMRSRKLAKQSAALQYCRKLFEIGELDENFLPKEQQLLDDMREILGPNFQPEIVEDGSAALGTKRRRQYYPKQGAALLSKCRPAASEPLFLYSISTKLVQSFRPDPSGRFIADESCVIGFLSGCPIPQIPAFNIYLHEAEYSVSIALVDSNFSFSPEQLNQIQIFHATLFEQVVRFSEAIALSFRADLEDGALYTVPLRKQNANFLVNWEVDWDIIAKVKDPSQYSVISQPDEIRKRMKINADMYKDGVVIRWYKTGDDRFFVLNVREDLTPTAEFQLDEFSSFAEYFERKYGIEIQQLDQFLLETKFCSRQMNLLRHSTFKEDFLDSKSSKFEKRKGGDMILVPELCQLFPFPASLYSKCLILPSVMHRLYWFCKVHDLRNEIRRETGIGGDVEDPLQWSPLVYGPRLAKKVELREFLDETDDLPDDFGLVYASFQQEKKNSEKFFLGKKNSEIYLAEIPESSTFGSASLLFKTPFRLDEQFHVDATKVPLPDLNDILNALVTTKAADGFNLERFEVIGDSFLKLATCIYVFFRFPQHQQTRMKQLCDQQVSNYNLYRLGKQKGLHNYILNQPFEPFETFVPPGFLFDEEESNSVLANSGKKSEKFPSPRIYQAIEDKTIADVVKALIGIFFIKSSIRSCQLFISSIGFQILPKIFDSEKKFEKSFGFFTKNSISNPILSNDPYVELNLNRLVAGFHDFETGIGYKFQNRAFLLQAFTHSSFYPNEITDCYQRLACLGDSILDFLITRFIFEDVKSFNPGMLSDMRSALVNKLTFSTLAVKYNYHKQLKFRSLRLHKIIEKFLQKFQENENEILPIRADMLCTNFEDEKEPEENSVDDAETPRALSDVFTSVAGAIFLDSGLSLDTVWRVYYNLMRHQIDHVIKNCPENPIRELMELEGANCRFGPFEQLGNGRSLVQVTVLGKGTYAGRGENCRAAKINASKTALEHLKRIQR